jgi:hypothetical protein
VKLTRRLAALLLVLGPAASASAVEKGQLGLDLEAGERRVIGVRYHLTPSFGVRTGIFFQHLEAENTLTILDVNADVPVFETTDTSFGGQLEVDYFLRPKSDLTPYLAATATYGHVNTAYPLSRGDGDVILRNGNLQSWSIGAGFGAQYAFSRSFQAFGRVALSYASSERFTLNGVKLHSHTLGTSSSAVGLAFYFN